MQGKITYLGHSSFLLEGVGANVLFDPSAKLPKEDGPRLIPFEFNPDTAKNIDLILITHEHEDHCDPATVERVVERTNATVVGPAPALAKINVPPRLKVEVKAGQAFNLRGIAVKVVKAVHPQSQYPVGYIVTV
ncbi:MAG TPA: MBL fold metallo-hydrolase, partial [Candidatus Micrarchaeota archaeon]|nr:MBL fold metallo-hydrolase [Candidatus Micrarchaeota archaeon]